MFINVLQVHYPTWDTNVWHLYTLHKNHKSESLTRWSRGTKGNTIMTRQIPLARGTGYDSSAKAKKAISPKANSCTKNLKNVRTGRKPRLLGKSKPANSTTVTPGRLSVPGNAASEVGTLAEQRQQRQMHNIIIQMRYNKEMGWDMEYWDLLALLKRDVHGLAAGPRLTTQRHTLIQEPIHSSWHTSALSIIW